MITKIYEVTCDYCLTAIYHGLGSKQATIQQMLNIVAEDCMIIYKGRHFCNEKCKNKWLENGKKDISGDRT